MNVRTESAVVWALGGLVMGGFLTGDLPFIPTTWAAPLLLGAGGLIAGRTSICRRNAGTVVGAAYGIVVWEIALANYLEFRGSLEQIDWYVGGLLTCPAGMLLALMLKLRREPRRMAMVGLASVAAHVVTRLWLEDYPSAIGIAALAIGVAVGSFIWRAGRAHESTGLVLGAAVGLVLAWSLLLPALSQRGIFWRINALTPQVVLAVMGALGAVLAGALLRSGQSPPGRIQITPDK